MNPFNEEERPGHDRGAGRCLPGSGISQGEVHCLPAV